MRLRTRPGRSWPTPRPDQGERPAIRPGVAAIIYGEGRRLLLHRRRVGGGWAPISGHVEPGETLTEALHREILEETGLTVTVERLVSLNSDPAVQIITYPDGRRVQFVTALFACRAAGGTLRGSDEGTEWGWFSPSDLPQPLLPYARVWLADAASAPSGEALIR
jgi:ADP-ribose pyrophosphatase YjhB (NUDIX family)